MTDQVMRWMPVSQSEIFHNSNKILSTEHTSHPKTSMAWLPLHCAVNMKILIDKVLERQLNESLTVTIHDNEC